MFDQIQYAIRHIRSLTDFVPTTAIVLGTGLGGLIEEVQVVAEVPYTDIPHFATSTVTSHRGSLVLGYLEGHPVVIMAGRLHYYEGWSMAQVTFPVRVMKALGATHIIITNVSGGVNPHLQAGDIVLVRDHINLLPEHPLRGHNDERLGPRFPDMLHTYSAAMRQTIKQIAASEQIKLFEGVYSALQGPNLETPAEYNMLHILGSDCTGMSSVPEVLVARHCGMEVMMLSMVANVAFPIQAIRETTLEEVVAVANAAEPKLRKLILGFLSTQG